MSERVEIHMTRSQKGVTLIEVIVAIAVFAIISLTMFSSVIAMKSVVNRQEEYVKLEMVCYDISAHYSKQTKELPWYNIYFNLTNDTGIGYLQSDFSPTLDPDEAAYVIEFSADRIISIYDIGKTITFVTDVKLPIGGN